MPTRSIFFHISGGQQVAFYLLAAVSAAICCWGVARRALLWKAGQPQEQPIHWPARIRELAAQVVAQKRTRRRRYAGTFHAAIFFGMIALFAGTIISGIEHYGEYAFGPHWFYKGAFYLACKVVLDLFGLLVVAGALMALGRRLLARPRELGQTPADDAFLVLLLLAAATGFLLEGAGISADPSRQPFAAFSPVGGQVAAAMGHVSPAAYAVIWWIHMPFVLTLVAVLPYGRWLHLFVIPPAVALQPNRPMGALAPVSMEQIEETGRVGVGQLGDLSRWQLMSLDGCMECGRCTEACPANVVGKELNPKAIVVDLRRLLHAPSQPESGVPPAHRSTDIISDESLWACTNCHACVRECPALIRHVDIIEGIRRYRVAEGRLGGSAAAMLRQLGSQENPWGLPPDRRMDWASGLDVPLASSGDGREVLLWVGCASAFEPRSQRSVRALAQLLRAAGVPFSVLGQRERCTGDPARRTGDELLYQQLAEQNITTLQEVGADRIVTPCPHCYNTLKNEYPAFGGHYQVQHHTELLAELQRAGRLKLNAGSERLTLHDPCFLARVNGVTAAPRAVLEGAGELAEASPSGQRTFCCGAGGGRMWMEEEPNRRPGVRRAEQLLATGAESIAVGCPFCKVMVGDSVAQVRADGPPVKDVAELAWEALGSNAGKADRTTLQRG